jgi:hypothetical protein
VLLRQAVQRGLVGAVALIVQRGAIGHLLGLPAGGARGRFRGVRPHGLRPCAAPLSPQVQPTGSRPVLLGLLRGLRTDPADRYAAANPGAA